MGRLQLAPLRYAALSAALFLPPAAGAEPPDAAVLAAQATALEHGEGVGQDFAQAAALYCEASRLGNAGAQFNLAWMYANGRGVARDDSLASFFFQLAAKQGIVQASNMLRIVGSATAATPDCMKDKTEAIAIPESINPEQKKIMALIHELAPEFAINPALALAVVSVESNFKVGARSPKNAQGLMQLIPETAERFKVKDSFDPVQNLKGGLAYLRWLLAYFQGDVALAAAAYNAGEGAVNKYQGIPPYQETRAYVQRILELFPKRDHPFDPAVTEPSPLMPRIRAKKLEG